MKKERKAIIKEKKPVNLPRWIAIGLLGILLAGMTVFGAGFLTYITGENKALGKKMMIGGGIATVASAGAEFCYSLCVSAGNADERRREMMSMSKGEEKNNER